MFDVVGLRESLILSRDRLASFSVLMMFSEERASGRVRVAVRQEHHTMHDFLGVEHLVTFTPDLIGTTTALFRRPFVRLSGPGRYAVEAWYNGEVIAERSLLVRSGP